MYFFCRCDLEFWVGSPGHPLGAVRPIGAAGPAPQRGRAHPQVRPRGRGARRRPQAAPRVTGNGRGAGGRGEARGGPAGSSFASLGVLRLKIAARLVSERFASPFAIEMLPPPSRCA